MTDHDDATHAHGDNDPGDPMLEAAARRLRQQAPDEIASRQALAQVEQRADSPTQPRRSWWPALIGAGLAAAAVVGVIAIRTDDTDTLTPVQTTPDVEPTPTATAPEPTTVPQPTATAVPTGASVVVDSGCITVTTTDGSATGCPLVDENLDHLEQRTFVANLDGPVLITSRSADPLIDLTATVDTGSFAAQCQWDDLAPRIGEGGLVELVVCNDTGVMGLTMPVGPFGDTTLSYFTLPTPYLPDGTDLGAGTPIDGLPRALAFTAAVDGRATCSILLLPDRTGWKEACGFIVDPEPTTALALVSPADTVLPEDATASTLTEITVDSAGLITSARLLDSMAPSSGCSANSASQFIQALPESSMVLGLGCIDDKASLITGSVLTQQGPPDGSIWTALRDEAGVWAITDSGTGIESGLVFPIVPKSVWETWPESTVPGFRPNWWEPIVAIPTQPSVDAFADDLLATIATLGGDPEFPLNERLIAVEPDGLPLIVARVDIGGDDSVAGQIIYVWLNEEFDENGPIGWQAGVVLVGEVCARGDTAGLDLCV